MPAAITLSTATLTPSCYSGEIPASITFTIANTGDGGSVLNYIVQEDGGWLSCSPTSGSITQGDPADTITVTYTTSSLIVGVYHCTILVTDFSASNDPQYITVTLTVNAPLNAMLMRGRRWFDNADEGFYLG